MRGIFLVMLCIAAIAQAAAKDDVFSWYDGGAHISYSLSKSVSPVVTTAIQMWGEDMMDVTGAKLIKLSKMPIQAMVLKQMLIKPKKPLKKPKKPLVKLRKLPIPLS